MPADESNFLVPPCRAKFDKLSRGVRVFRQIFPQKIRTIPSCVMSHIDERFFSELELRSASRINWQFHASRV